MRCEECVREVLFLLLFVTLAQDSGSTVQYRAVAMVADTM